MSRAYAFIWFSTESLKISRSRRAAIDGSGKEREDDELAAANITLEWRRPSTWTFYSLVSFFSTETHWSLQQIAKNGCVARCQRSFHNRVSPTASRSYDSRVRVKRQQFLALHHHRPCFPSGNSESAFVPSSATANEQHTEEEERKRREKLHHQTQAWFSIAFPNLRTLSIPRHTQPSEHNRIEFHFLFLPSPKKKHKIPLATSACWWFIFSWSVERWTSSHSYSARVIGNYFLLCLFLILDRSRSYAGGAECQICALGRGE